VTYLIARVKGTEEIKGYRFSRITSMPIVLPDTFVHDESAVDVARAWRPEFSRSPTPLDVVVTTNENYADLLVRQYPGSLAANKKDGKVEVGLSFDSPRAALRFVVEGADRIRLQSPKSLKSDLADWLKDVNRGKAPSIEELKFTARRRTTSWARPCSCSTPSTWPKTAFASANWRSDSPWTTITFG